VLIAIDRERCTDSHKEEFSRARRAQTQPSRTTLRSSRCARHLWICFGACHGLARSEYIAWRRIRCRRS